ncbi:MAG: protein translocase subunit SecF [Candidatus Falkowbacteria bacterium]|nr:protein translocase subunit SecF [Candidatus Falkowbacteria bacterium]
MLNIIQNRKIWLTFSGILVALSIASLSFWGLNFGIDFTGGSLLEVEFSGYQPAITDIQDSLRNVGASNLVIQPTQSGTTLLRFKESTQEVHQAINASLSKLATDHKGSAKELRFDSIGPSIGNELKSKSFNAVIVVLLAMVAFIAFAFRKVSKPVASWKYGMAAIVALAHDVIVVLGVFSVLGHFLGTEVNTAFIAAVLTVLGYSVNDTIIVFDRTRENLPKSSQDFENTVNTSVNQVLTRSINTSFSAILALLAILFFGGSSIRDFALALAVGIFVGTYSSIFIASPMIVIWEKMGKKRA